MAEDHEAEPEPTPIDWEQLPVLTELARYEATEAGIRQFLIDRGVDLPPES